MATQRQIAANRRNAKKSTGPNSSEGKARSGQNALTHGLTAHKLLLPNEDPAEFNALRLAMYDRFSPGDVLEDELVEQAVSLLWRLRRIPAFEAVVLQWMKHYQGRCYDTGPFNLGPDAVLKRLPKKSADGDGPDNAMVDTLEVGRALETFLRSNVAIKLNRYEISLQRQLLATIRELRDLKAARPDLSQPGEASLQDGRSGPARLSDRKSVTGPSSRLTEARPAPVEDHEVSEADMAA